MRLIESGVRQPTRAGWTLASSFAHGSIIGMVAVMTLRAVTSPMPPRRIETLYFTEDVAPPATRSAPGSRATGSGVRATIPSIPLPDIPGISVELPNRFDLGAVELMPSDRPGIGSGGGGAPGAGIVESGGVHESSQVDRAVVPRRDNPRPDYPARLRAASLEGDVLVRFIVDTSGRVEAGSITILGTTHPLFGDAVRRWLPRTRYTAAESGERRVRQLVQQRVAFELTR